MAVYIAPYVDVGVNTDIYASGDALGIVKTFTNIPEHGVIMAVSVIDRDKESANLDLVLFTKSPTATAANAEYTPIDADLAYSPGSVLVATWKAFKDNSQGVEDNVGLPYWAPSGVLYFQCVTRGTPTYTAATDLWISISIVH